MPKCKVKGDEHICRVNYLFQASREVVETSPNLSQFYGKVLTTISEKTPAKLDFTLKRGKCTTCHVALLPGVNARYRLRRKKGRKGHPTQIITCLLCGTVKRFLTNPNFELKISRNGQVNTR